MASPYRLIEHESKPRLQAVRCRNATSTSPLPCMRCPKAALSNKAKRRCPPESKGGKKKKNTKPLMIRKKKIWREGKKMQIHESSKRDTAQGGKALLCTLVGSIKHISRL
jgi:hypothetical protein